MTLEEKRYIDSGKLLGAYAQNAFAVCPSCGGPALVRSPTRYAFPFRSEKARVHCLRCSFLREREDKAWFGPVIGCARERCPGCGYKWLEAFEQRTELNERQRQSAEVACPQCHQTATLELVWYRDTFSGEAVDPAFGLPLWLQTSCCGQTLWIYNREHLEALRSYVAAMHRERHPTSSRSMIARLPQWIKSAKNREEIVRCTRRLEQLLLKAEQI